MDSDSDKHIKVTWKGRNRISTIRILNWTETTWLCEPENDLRTRYIQNQPFNEASKTRPRCLYVPRYLYQKGQHSSEEIKELVVEGPSCRTRLTWTWIALAGGWASAPWCAPAACQCSPPDLWPAASASSAQPPALPAKTSAAQTPPSAPQAAPPAGPAEPPVHCGSDGSTNRLRPSPAEETWGENTGKALKRSLRAPAAVLKLGT